MHKDYWKPVTMLRAWRALVGKPDADAMTIEDHKEFRSWVGR